MSVEAFIWNYRNGAPIGFDFGTVRGILATDEGEWLDESAWLRVRFCDPDDVVDIFFGQDAPRTNHADGITVSRPITHPEFLQRIFRVLQLGDVMLFYSDETTPIFVRGADPAQYPSDLLKELGKPRFVESPAELIQSRSDGIQ
jgi:hypothetical protein